MKYGEMTALQRLQWGLAEVEARKNDLANVMGQEGLDEAQENAVRRRRLIGANRQQATRMVIEANRYMRRGAPVPQGETA